MIVSSQDRLGRRGTPLFALQNIVKSRGVSLINYSSSNPGNTYITCSNKIPRDLPKHVRVVVYLGSERSGKGLKCSNTPWGRINYVVYISNFYKKLVSEYPIVCDSSVINWIGGAPADLDALSPILNPRKINGTIYFICCAKWWKRRFKRLRQTVKLFNDFILKRYPDSKLLVLGCNIPSDKRKGKVYYYKKSHGDPRYVDLWKKSHIHISLTPFDSGPMTLNESLHYRVPFICTHNSAASDYISHLGKCGEVIQIDRSINSLEDFRKCNPFKNKKHYDKEINYDLVLKSICKIVENFEEYTSWKWTDKFNYKVQTDKWMKALGG